LALSSPGRNVSERLVAVSDAEYVIGIVIFLVTFLEFDDVSLIGRLSMLEVYVKGARPSKVVLVIEVNNASVESLSRVIVTVSPDCKSVGVTVISKDSKSFKESGAVYVKLRAVGGLDPPVSGIMGADDPPPPPPPHERKVKLMNPRRKKDFLFIKLK